MQQPLLNELKRLGIKGSVLIAPEGVNGTVAGTREAIDEFLSYLSHTVVGAPLEHKESLYDTQPFGRAKVRLKKETISIGEPTDINARGQYVEPQDWNQLISDPDTIVLDTRNSYEVHLGTFEGAIDPHIRTFKQLPGFIRSALGEAKNKKIATFCTGGIRCEKLTAWMISQGYKDVYHLKGGILKYLEEIPAAQSKWQGECYVFDERVAVGHGLVATQTATMCPACGHALTPEDRAHPDYIEESCCPYCELK